MDCIRYAERLPGRGLCNFGGGMIVSDVESDSVMYTDAVTINRAGSHCRYKNPKPGNLPGLRIS